MTEITAPVIGYRAWRVDAEGQLFGSVAVVPWRPGENAATCAQPHHAKRHLIEGRKPPVAECSCGLYANHEFEDVLRPAGGDWVMGAARGWGRVEIHPNGWRAEYAEVIALMRISAAQPGHILRAAQRYGVPLLDTCAEIEAVATELGEVVPQSLRPTPNPDESTGLPTATRPGLIPRLTRGKVYLTEDETPFAPVAWMACTLAMCVPLPPSKHGLLAFAAGFVLVVPVCKLANRIARIGERKR